jgi:hypothetical protein
VACSSSTLEGRWLGGPAGRTAHDSPLSDSRVVLDQHTDPGAQERRRSALWGESQERVTERVLSGAARARPAGTSRLTVAVAPGRMGAVPGRGGGGSTHAALLTERGR